MGIEAIPNCFDGWFCDIVNFLVKWIVYFKLMQNNVGPAGYFRDTAHLDFYNEYNVFLPKLNNEVFHEKYYMNKSRF